MQDWIETTVDVKSIDWKGKPVLLRQVPAVKHVQTGRIRVYPADVAKAEIRLLTRLRDLEPRDASLLLILYAKPGTFKEGEVLFKYHLNKMLFYLWKEMEAQTLGDTFPKDNFIIITK